MNLTTKAPDAYNTIILGGLVAGVLDAVNAVIAYGTLGQNPVHVLQYVASGILGDRAYAGFTATGLFNAGLGAALHFFIACVVAAAYYAGALGLPILGRRPVAAGLLFGASVYLFMTFIVLPNTNVTKTPFSLGLFLNGVIGHALFVGLPIALYATRSGRRSAVVKGARRSLEPEIRNSQGDNS